jgi:RNA polymerase sigma-70 factor (ECF subfamily)
MDLDTNIGGDRDRFPVTQHSAIVGVRSNDSEARRRAFETILTVYWKPVYKYIRIKWQASNEDAKDFTQGFFAIALEKNYFANYDSAKASFQTYLRTCLDGFIANQKKSEQRLKRGGGSEHISLDFVSAENELARPGVITELSAEDYFHREWVRNLFALAVEALRHASIQNGRGVHFRLFELYDLQDNDSPQLTYADLAYEFGITTTDVNNYLSSIRREFRRIVLQQLSEITANEEEFQNEARAVLGIRIK